MKYAALITFFLFVSYIIPQKDPMYNQQGKPSTWGVTTYISNNEESLIAEYEYRIDTIYDVYIFAEKLIETSDDNELGQFYLPDNVVITNEERYVAYEFKDLSKFKQRSLNYTDRTVKAVVFHELTHAYFNQILLIRKYNDLSVSPEYGTIRMFPNPTTRFGAEFIEEGVCEYVVYYLDESAPLKNVPIPDNEEDLVDTRNAVNNLYYYSVIFLKDFLDENGLEKGIEILISNKPPTYQEILKPELYFKRLNYGETNQ